jgi:hypothetical protein
VTTPKPSWPVARFWRAINKKCDRFEDGPTRIAIVMAIVAALSAVTAYRSTDEERKSAMCDRQYGQAQTYELVQRQRYLDAQIEHQRWSDRYELATFFSETLLRNATAGRARHPGLGGGHPALLDVEAQLERAVRRGIGPVSTFTDPGLSGGADDLEGALRARAEQDVKDLGISERCAVHENVWWAVTAAAPSGTAHVTSENYLDRLHDDVSSLHRKALDDAVALLVFIIVLVLFSLSVVFENTTRRVFEIIAMIAIPISLIVAVTRSDEGMTLLLWVANTLIGLFLLAWVILKLHALRHSQTQRTDPVKPSPAGDAAKPTFKSSPGSRLARYIKNLGDPNVPKAQRKAPATDVTRAIRRMEIAIGVVALLCLAFGAAIAAHDFPPDSAAHLTRTAILVVALLPTIAFTFAAWWAVNAMEHVCAAQVQSQKGVDISKEPFVCVVVALVALGVFVIIAPCVAIVVEHGSFGWLPIVGSAGAVLVAVSIGGLILIERWMRRRAPELHAAGQQSVATAKLDLTVGDANSEALLADPSATTSPVLRTVHDPFSRLIVLLIAITALFSAGMTCLYTREAGQANEFAARAAAEQLNLMRSSSRRAVLAYRTIERLVTLREVRLRNGFAKDLRAYAAAKHQGESVAIWDHEARRWQRAWETVEAILKADDQGDAESKAIVNRVVSDPNGLDDDPSFMAKLFVESTIRTAAERLGLWDAYDEAGTASEIRADLLLAGGTFFVIALYLFGQSLGMKSANHASRVLTYTGIALLVGGVGFASYGLLQPVPAVERNVTVPKTCRTGDDLAERTIANAAAICYARAELLTALRQDPDFDRRAQEAYDAAIRDDMRPGFTLAHYRSIVARSQAATPQRTEPIAADDDTLKKIIEGEHHVIEDLEARERAVPVSLRESFGFHQYLRAIYRKDAALLDRAVEDLRTAAGTEPRARFRLGVALLAAHRLDDSDAYRSLESPLQNDELKIAAINDLELLRNHCPPWWQERGAALEREPTCQRALQEIIDDREASIVQKRWPTDRSVTVKASHGELNAYATPGGVKWGLQITHSASVDLPLIMVVSKNDEKARDDWYVVASASGPVHSSEITHREGRDITGFRNVLPDGGACLSRGARYRIQLWLGKRVLADRITAVLPSLPSFGTIALHAQDATLCVPDGTDGWIRSLLHPHHLEASYGVRQDPAAKDAADMDVTGVDLFAFILPRDASPDAGEKLRNYALQDAMQRRTGDALSGRRSFMTTDPCPDAPGIPQRTRVTWAFSDFKVLGQTWSSRDGLFHVALVWNTDPSKIDVTCAVLASLTDLEVGPTTSGG